MSMPPVKISVDGDRVEMSFTTNASGEEVTYGAAMEGCSTTDLRMKAIDRLTKIAVQTYRLMGSGEYDRLVEAQRS